MAISPFDSPSLERRAAAQTISASAHARDTAKPLDWNQVLIDKDRILARASLRPDTAASIRAAQNVWLASQDKQADAMRTQHAEGDIEAFITMLVAQASLARAKTNDG